MSQTEATKVVLVRAVVPEPENRPFDVMIVALGTSHPYIAKFCGDAVFEVEITALATFEGIVSIDIVLNGSYRSTEAYCEITCEELTTGRKYVQSGHCFGAATLNLKRTVRISHEVFDLKGE